MTDLVTKYLKIEYLVAENLGSSHIPPHYLCNAYASEKFDEIILSVLVDIEKQIEALLRGKNASFSVHLLHFVN